MKTLRSILCLRQIDCVHRVCRTHPYENATTRMRGLVSLETRNVSEYFFPARQIPCADRRVVSLASERTKHARAVADKGFLRLDIIVWGKTQLTIMGVTWHGC